MITQCLDAAVEHPGIVADDLPRHGLDLNGLFHATEDGLHRLRIDPFNAPAGLPVPQNPLRSAEAGAGVDDGCATHRLPQGDGDDRPAEGGGETGVPVQLLDTIPRGALSVVHPGEVSPFLDDGDGQTGLGQFLGHDGATSARTDDCGVNPLLYVALNLRVSDGL